MKKLFMFLLMAIMSARAMACDMCGDNGYDHVHTEVVNGIKWSYKIESGEAKIVFDEYECECYDCLWGGDIDFDHHYPYYEDYVYYHLSLSNYHSDYSDDKFYYSFHYFASAINSNTKGDVTIPSVLGGCPVTVIDREAFKDCSKITSIAIPSSVRSIGDGVFYGCSSLTSITIPSSVTNISNNAFINCLNLNEFIVSIANPNYKAVNGLLLSKDGKTLYKGVNRSVTIPSSVTNIADGAFYGCSSLTNITIPSSVISIGDRAFYGCSGLASITIPSSVTSIGSGAFYGCSGLTNITIPSSVISIGNEAFGGCSGLASITIPSSVTSIGSGAFYGCSGLASIIIPSSVTNIADGAFSGCSSLTNITIPSSVISIGNDAFVGCSGLASITIPSSVTSIGDEAFGGCSGLTSITIPSSVTSIGECAFYGCSGLASITIPSSVRSIGYGAFYGCKKLTSVTIPSKVTSIGKGAFYGCSSLTNITIPSSVRSIGDEAFYGCKKLTSVTIPSGVSEIGMKTFYGCKSLTNITIPSSVTRIYGSVFYDCNNLKTVIFLGHAPKVDTSGYLFYNVAKGFCIKVIKGTKGWSGNPTSTDLPNTWQGFSIKYGTKYTIAFNANGGTGSMKSQSILVGATTYLPKNTFERKGYAFAGWAKTKNGAVAYKDTALIKNLLNSSGTVTLYAVWVKTSYKIGFYANGGSGKMPAQVMTYNKAAYLNKNTFTRTGYVFAGWAKTPTGAVAYKNGKAVKNLAKSGGTVKLYAVWKPITYKVAFYANGGTGKMAVQAMTYGKAAYLNKNAFKRTGYTFLGWAKSAALAKKGKVSYKNRQAVKNLSKKSGTVKLIAVWKPITYKVAFYANGGTGKMAAQAMTYGKAAYLNKNAFKRTGYTFLGWAKSAALAKKGKVSYKNRHAVKNLLKKSGTVKLIAVWKPITYKVAFYANGGTGVMTAQTMIYDRAAYLNKNAFTRPGYTFAGWAKSAALAKKGKVSYKNRQAVKNLLKKTGEVKLIAVWNPVTYKVAFYPNGGSGKAFAQSMTYNKAAYLSKNTFKRTGYIFLGWAKTKDGAVAYKNAQAVKNLRSTKGSIKLYAVWAKSKYKVAFYANGGTGSMSAQSMTYNKAAYLNDNTFTRTGYTFAGWAKTPTGSVAYTDGKAVKNLTTTGATIKLYAVWEFNTDNVHNGVQLWEGGPYWAETNIGAENPEDYGYYFWWGDTIGYKWENNKWVASDGSSSNFSFEEANAPTCGKDYAAIDNEGWTICSVLAPKYDAARAHWGENWRMPTEIEFEDLRDNCIWTWTTINGVEGYVVSGKGVYSDASIFIPAAGYGDGINFSLDYYTGPSDGLYWSSVARSILSPSTSFLEFDYDDLWVPMSGARYLGYPVRPVSDVH